MQYNAVQIIKESLSILDVIQWYGYTPNSKGFINCPFHTEKTPSFKINLDDNSFHCFGCGIHGDIITFVQKLFDLPFNEALIKIDNDFNLNIYGDKTFAQMRVMHYKQKSFNAKRERLKREKELKKQEYWQIFDEWKRLDDNKKKYAPATEDEDLHPLFVEALQKLPHQEHLLNQFESKRWLDERRNNSSNASQRFA